MTTAKVGCKIGLELDEATGRVLDSQSKICNWLYNRLLERANDLKQQFKASGGQDNEAARTVYSKRGLRDLVPGLKEEFPFLRTVYSSPLKNAALRLSASIREYQKSHKGQRKGGAKVNWPKFRSWKSKWFSLLYDEPWKGYSLDGQNLTLSLGVDQDGTQMQVTMRLAEPLAYEQVKSLRIVKEMGRFYAVFTVLRELPAASPSVRAIALDPNHKNLAYGVGTDGQGIEIENMPHLKALDRRIDELKSKRDRCKRRSRLIEYTRADGSIHRHWQPSRRWRRYDEALTRLYRLRREQTKTYLFTVANKLCREYSVIAVGDYVPHGGGITTGMRRAMNNQSLIGRFKKTVGWVAQRSGRVYLEYNETGTTRTCADCGAVIEGGLALDIREWECPDCHTFHLRDENAGRNGLRRVLQTFVPGSGQRAVKVTVRCTWRVTPTGVVTLPGGGTASLLEAPARGIKPGAQLPAPDPLTRVGDLISG